MSAAESLYTELVGAGIEVLFDDRAAVMPGEKFADADLLGMPLRIVVSEKTLTAGKLECTERHSGHTTHKSLPELMGQLTVDKNPRHE